MAVKVDKDFLLKHRFWILIGVFAILALVPPILLTTGVSDFVEKKRTDYKNAKSTVEGITNPMNEKFVEAYEIKDKFVADKKNEMHEKAWRSQSSMMTYPPSLAPALQGKYFGDAIDYHDLDTFNRDYNLQLGGAVVEVQPLLPQTGFEDGVVQFANNNIEGVLRLNVAFAQLPPSKEDFWLAQEDLWMKREMLRIVRAANESVARFHAADEEEPVAEVKKPEQASDAKPANPAEAKPANPAEAKPANPAEAKPANPAEAKPANPAEAKPAEGSPPAAEKPAPKPVVAKKPIDLNHRVFRNQHWELDLTLKEDQINKKFMVGGTIKNIGYRRRPLGVVFKVLLQPGADAAGVPLPVDREPLAVGETWTIPTKEFSANQVAFQGLHGVEEQLTWRTAPVKKIEALELDYSWSRMANRTLKPPRWYVPPVDATAGAEGAGHPGGFGGKMMNMSAGGPGGMGAGSSASPVSKNGLSLNRYIDTNEQVRHMPVGMVVVADDEHLAELLSAFTNSRLRIQVTQCHWQVCRDKMAPISADSSPGAPAGPGRGSNLVMGRGLGGGKGMGTGDEGRAPGGRGNNIYRGAPGGRMGGASLPGNFSGPGGPLPGRPGLGGMKGLGGMGGMGGIPGSIADGEEEENLNLLEVAVYGVASIYEEYPPKPPDAATPDAAAGQPPALPKP